MRNFIRYKATHNFLVNRKIREIRSFHEMDVNRLREYENNQFLDMLNHAYLHAPFYKKYYDDFGVNIKSIQSINDIALLPPIDKAIVWNFKKDILTRPAVTMIKGYTSGTSGSSLTVYRSLGAIMTENAYVWHFRNMHGVHLGDKLVVLRGDLNRDQLSKFDKYTNTLYLSSYNINKKNIYKYIKLLVDFRPKCIMGYPSSLELLSSELCMINTTLNIPIAITSSETLYGFQRVKIKNFLGAEVFDWYGNAERTVAIQQCVGGQYHFVPGYSVNEVFEDHLLTSSLFNNGFPLIRYKVNDVIELGAAKGDRSCPTGNKVSTEHAALTEQRSQHKIPASVRVEKIHGRDDDYIFLPDGTKIGRMSKAIKGIDDILFAQILQDQIDGVVLNIVPATATFDTTVVLQRMRLLLGERIRIDTFLVTEDKIQKTSAGKYKLVINSLHKKS